jgi:flagellar hook-basal body complex protein FliE
MTSPISAISGLNGVSALSGISGVAPTNPISSSAGIEATSGPNTDFAGMLADGLQNVQNLQSKSDDLAVKVADGTLADPAQYTMASTEATLAVQLTMAVRNKAVEAFQEIMRMQA